MKKFRGWATYTLGIGFLVPVMAFGAFLYMESAQADPARNLEATLSRALLGDGESDKLVKSVDDAAWRAYYPETVPMKIGGVPLQASVAKTWPERIQGLSGTPYLPEEVAKFFVFESDAFHSIWMKDMNYPIDIIWVDTTGTVVDFAAEVSPDSYPETFTPEVPARYVVEVASGFVARHDIAVGTKVILPQY